MGLPTSPPDRPAARSCSSRGSRTRRSGPSSRSSTASATIISAPRGCCSTTVPATGRAPSLPSAASVLDEVSLPAHVLPARRRRAAGREHGRRDRPLLAGPGARPRRARSAPAVRRRRDPGHAAARAVRRARGERARPADAGRPVGVQLRAGDVRPDPDVPVRASRAVRHARRCLAGCSRRSRAAPTARTLRALGLDFDLVNSYGGGEARLFAVMGEAFRDQFISAGRARQADRRDRPPDPRRRLPARPDVDAAERATIRRRYDLPPDRTIVLYATQPVLWRKVMTRETLERNVRAIAQTVGERPGLPACAEAPPARRPRRLRLLRDARSAGAGHRPGRDAGPDRRLRPVHLVVVLDRPAGDDARSTDRDRQLRRGAALRPVRGDRRHRPRPDPRAVRRRASDRLLEDQRGGRAASTAAPGRRGPLHPLRRPRRRPHRQVIVDAIHGIGPRETADADVDSPSARPSRVGA